MAVLTMLLLIAGIGLVLAGLVLPTHGVLATTGVATVIAGIVPVVFGATEGIVGALLLAAPVIAGLGAFALLALRLTLAADRQKARCGAEGLLGHVGVVRRPLDPTGHVAIDGELWRARRSWAAEDEAPAAGDPVIVDRVDGLTLTVRPAEAWELEP
jgi:membrane-bound ClpP family serine protease